MAGKLDGRRMVLTGISRGVGLEIARRFLAEGADILGVARDPGRLAEVTSVLEKLAPGRVGTLVVDVGQPGAEEAIAIAVEERWAALDVLINNAAIMIDPPTSKGLLDQPASTLETSLEVNLLAPFRIARALVPHFGRGIEPRIVHVSSGAGSFAAMGEVGIASYRLSKWALNGLTMLMARELEGRIAVNAFDPGWVKTDLGGPNAPGDPAQSAEGALAVVTLPFSETGKFWKDGAATRF